MNYQLNPQTQVLLSQLTAASWFAQVGQPPSENWQAVKSWDAATAECSNDAYESFGLAMANHIRHVVRRASVARYQQWNAITGAVRPQIVDIATLAVSCVPASLEVINVIRHQVSWDLIHACIESEYSDIFPPGFYLDTAKIYASGRFPCGWKGEYPQGQRVVY